MPFCVKLAPEAAHKRLSSASSHQVSIPCYWLSTYTAVWLVTLLARQSGTLSQRHAGSRTCSW